MRNYPAMFILLLFSLSACSLPDNLLELEELTDDGIYASIDPMIDSCEDKLRDGELSPKDQSKARKMKRLLSYLPTKKPKSDECIRAKNEFMTDFAIPGEDLFDSYLSEEQKAFWRIFLRLCSDGG